MYSILYSYNCPPGTEYSQAGRIPLTCICRKILVFRMLERGRGAGTGGREDGRTGGGILFGGTTTTVTENGSRLLCLSFWCVCILPQPRRNHRLSGDPPRVEKRPNER